MTCSHRHFAGWVAGFLTAASLLMLTTTASARTFQLTARLLEIFFRELTIEGPGTTVLRCELNLQGSLASTTVAKVRESVIGDVYAYSSKCASGRTFSVLARTLPWHISYTSFQGTLPAIRQINLQLDNGGFTVTEGTGTCLFEFTRANGFVFALGLESGPVTEVITNERALVRRASERAECRGERIFQGTGELHAAVTTQSPTMTLI